MEEYHDGDGLPHRIGGPAIVRDDGVRFWYHHGSIHRRGGPAITYPNEHRCWYHHGCLMRRGGPAWDSGDSFEWIVNQITLTALDLLPRPAHPIMELFL